MTMIPLSRSHVHSPWPVAAFNVMSKPGGAGCNLACEYCFYRHNQKDEGGRMKDESTHEKAASACAPLVSGGSQGGRNYLHVLSNQ